MQRNIDQHGRILIPNKFFKELEFSERQNVEVFIEHGKLSIRKFQRENWQARPFVGVVRSIDEFHRLTIPAEYFHLLEKINPGDIVDLELKNGSIQIKNKS